MTRRGSSLLVMLLTITLLAVLGALLGARVWSREREGIGHLAAARVRILADGESEELLATWNHALAESLPIGSRTMLRTVTASPGLVAGDSLLRLDSTGFLLQVIAEQRRSSGELLARAGVWRVVSTAGPAIPDTQAIRSSGPVAIGSGATVAGRDTALAAWGATCPTLASEGPGIVAAPAAAVDVACAGGACVTGAPPIGRDSTPAAGSLNRLGLVSLEALIAGADVRLQGQLPTAAPSDSGGGCLAGAPGNLGEPLTAGGTCFDYLPLIIADSGAGIRGGVGQGILVGLGPLDLSGDFAFHGVVVARGPVRIRDGARVLGTVLSASGVEVEGSGQVRRSHCAVVRAVSGRRWPARGVRRGWVFRP